MIENLIVFTALLGGLFWGFVFALDRAFMTDKFNHAFQPLFITGLFTPFGAIVPLLLGATWPQNNVAAWMAFLAGLALAGSYFFYFLAMEMGNEAEEIAAWDAAHPLLIALFSMPLGLRLTGNHWAGIIIVIGAVLLFQCHKGLSFDAKVEKPFLYRLLLLGNTVLMAVTYLVMGLAIKMEGDYWNVYSLYLAGTSMCALIIFWPPVWRSFGGLKGVIATLKKYSVIFSVMEFCNIAAPLLITFSMTVAHPAISAALGATFPIWLLVIGIRLRHLGYASEKAFPFISKKDIMIKIIIFVFLAIGVGLLHDSSVVNW